MTTSITPFQQQTRRLAAQYHWGLLTESAWIAAARQINPEPEDERAARRACLTVYSRVLYDACQDRRRQDQAYRELYDYLYPQALARDAGLAYEATQDAIVLVFRSFAEPKLKKCRIPEAFLFFAQGKLRDAFTRLIQKHGGKDDTVSIEEPGDGDQEDGRYRYDLCDPHTPGSEIENDEREAWIKAMILVVAEAVLHCLQTLWREYRLRRQVETLALTFMDRMADERIAARLRKTKGAVQLLRTHALDNLRTCLDLRLPLSWGEEP